MARILVALAGGLVFGLGLTVSQMVNPAKVLAFLDLFGDWDPSLALVMLGAIPIAAIGYHLSRGRPAPLCNPTYAAPTQAGIDVSLVCGAALFGIGWGLVGYCPGPAITSIALGNWATPVFVAAMLIGMVGFSGYQSLSARRLSQV